MDLVICFSCEGQDSDLTACPQSCSRIKRQGKTKKDSERQITTRILGKCYSSKTSTARISPSGERWLYRWVILKSLCPMSSFTLYRSTPRWTSHEAKVCRRVWKYTRSRLSVTPSLNMGLTILGKIFETVSMTLPFLDGKIRSESGPLCSSKLLESISRVSLSGMSPMMGA